MGTVGYGLKRFKDTEELLHATYDAFHAVRDAVRVASRLHRDVSIGNIILVREGGQEIRKGYLIDWDACCPVSETGECVEAGRVGTWHFMSQKLLSPEGRERKPTLEDDMESLFYVVLYCSLLWLPHNLVKARLALIVFRIFEKRDWDRDQFYGGDGKLLNAFDRLYTRMVTFNEPLHEWLQTVMDYHSPQVDGQYVGYWSNPDHLDNFWGNFLETHDLPQNDRVTHDHPAASGIYNPRSSEIGLYSSEVIWLGNPCQEDPEVAAPPVGTKRKRRAPVDWGQSAAYRGRLRSGGAVNGP
ncbi:hypothetical protein GSI_15135 [Ganoderma sinense ZZ0214-1]|uniref:Fungal-type protein kinase domain-containing protein n=1 Tax=Ganoderma sinense ZZ0214-1 TaxID=1077348 RepID=A0A2G8RLQ3_9APHY|nr:hypothetical protein GSI_15135 [Ganoderma sinense ZZ0214-1]